jgi:membrane-associated phospholipid phosphatase
VLPLIRSLARSIGNAIRNDPEVMRLLAFHPRAVRFITDRFRRDHAFGLNLTLGLAVTLGFLIAFGGIVQDLIAGDPLVRSDLRVLSLVQTLRSPILDQAMLFITYLGNAQIVLTSAALVSVYFALTRRWLWLAALVLSLIGEESLVWTAKVLFARERPDLVNALVVATGPSFPSGHGFVAFAFWGLIAWFAITSSPRFRARIAIATATLLGIGTLGFSRVYLGVHWPSDVMASFAGGAAWLSLLITALGVVERSGIRDIPRPLPGGRVVAGFLGLVWLGSVIAFFVTHPLLHPESVAPLHMDLAKDSPPDVIFTKVPRFSEDITGTPIEPINVIIIGSEADLTRALEAAHWQPAAALTLVSAVRMSFAELFNRPYPQAPGLPAFWNGVPNDRTFERPTASESARERHHLHLWNTPLTLGSVPIWLGTVHLDKKGSLGAGLHVPIHEIDPAVDREREALRRDLNGGVCVQGLGDVAVVEPMLGHNALQSPFFTDGRALVVRLKCAST